MKRLVATAFVAVLVVPAAALAEKKSDPTGTWKWRVHTPRRPSYDATLKLKMDGDKLTGVLMGQVGETQIEDGRFLGGEVSFTVTYEGNGKKTTMRYSGRMMGDTIKGKVEFEREGKPEPRDWEARRSKD